MTSDFADLPCGLHCEADCEIHSKMIELQQSLALPPDDEAKELVSAFSLHIMTYVNHLQACGTLIRPIVNGGVIMYPRGGEINAAVAV